MRLQQKTTQAKLVNREGSMLPMLAVVMVILIISVAIGVDIARMHLTRTELRTANDAAARAAVIQMGISQNRILAKDAAVDIAARNQVAGKGLTLAPDQILLGTAVRQDSGSFTFSEASAGSSTILTSARVEGRRCANSPDGEVKLLFGPLFGVESFCSDSVSTATQSHRDIALVLDVSGSMKDDGRFEALEEALDTFLSILESTPQSEAVSLTVYETTSRKIQPITSDMDLVRNAFADESPGGRTAIGLGMTDGLDSILNDLNARPHAIRSLIVMTDGNHNEGIDPEEVVIDCVASHVSVFTVTFSSGANQNRMESLANDGQGFHIHADNAEELNDAFEQIARQLAVLLIE